MKTVTTHDGYELSVYRHKTRNGDWFGWYFTTPDGEENGSMRLDAFAFTTWRRLAGMVQDHREDPHSFTCPTGWPQ